MQPSDPITVHDRRRFLKLMGLVGVSSALGTAAIRLDAAENAKAAKPAAAAVPKAAPPAPATPASPPVEISEDARALAAIVERRYGKHLDAKQLHAVTEDLEQGIQSGQRLRAVKLANGDEPDTVFRA